MVLSEKIALVQEKIAEAAKSAGRSPSEIRLVAVTKYSTADEILQAYNEGLGIFGENRIQDAMPKMDALPPDIEWHLIGHLQSNKVKLAVGRFALIHSVDSLHLAEEIEKISAMRDYTQQILVEVNITSEMTKFGAAKSETKELVGRILELGHLNLTGFMTMAPLIGSEEVIKGAFSGLRKLRDDMESEFGIDLPELSMGMTNDFELAIREGATIVRIGSAIFR